jgi:excisionase family DNA binding protein
VSIEPELITIDQAAELCDCDKSVITALVHDRETNGFPAIVLGKRTIRIDKRRLQRWFQNGGLAE